MSQPDRKIGSMLKYITTAITKLYKIGQEKPVSRRYTQMRPETDLKECLLLEV